MMYGRKARRESLAIGAAIFAGTDNNGVFRMGICSCEWNPTGKLMESGAVFQDYLRKSGSADLRTAVWQGFSCYEVLRP